MTENSNFVPPVSWFGFYTKRSAPKPRRWFGCKVVGYDNGKVVLRTKKGHYHGHDPEHFEFRDSVPDDEISMGAVHG